MSVSSLSAADAPGFGSASVTRQLVAQSAAPVFQLLFQAAT